MISNISSLRGLHNLKGMTPKIIERDVIILRPFLKTSKQSIYDCATLHEIPHLEDSTPKWSRRGKLRDHIIPAIQEHEPNFFAGLHIITQCLQENFMHIQNDPNSIQLPRNFLNLKHAITNKAIKAAIA